MVLANLRARLTAVDIRLVVHVLARGDGVRRRRLMQRVEQDGIDTLLDAPGLLDALQALPPTGPSLALFLYVAVRSSLRSIGIDDARLTDYLGALLFEFGLRDRPHRISRHDDQTYRYLSDIVADIESVSGWRGFLLRAHLGNFSLWLAGVFPDYIIARQRRKGGPDLSYYDRLGARGFRLASDHRLAQQYDVADLYARAAEAFPRLRVALNRLSDRIFFPNRSSPDRLLRVVADEFNLTS